MTEKTIWKGTPSHWTNSGVYILSLLAALTAVPLYLYVLDGMNLSGSMLGIIFGIWLGVPLLYMFWKWLLLKSWKIEVTDQRIIEEKGVFSKETDEIELYRVKDFQLKQPFLLRLVGLSNIDLLTSDKSNPEFTIPAIKKGKQMKEELRLAIDKRRDEKRVREADLGFDGAMD
ncbi:MAG: PH domain-containing protein [Bacteroidota bacterium]